MKTLLNTFLLLLLIQVSLFAQSNSFTTIYNEDFDGKTKWIQGSNDTRDFKTYNGKYYFEHKRTDKSWYISSTAFNLNDNNDFEIETSLQKISGIDNSGICFWYDFKDSKNYKEFSIASNGYFRIAESVNGNYKNLKEWTKSDIVASGKYGINKLTIKKTNNTVTFFLNGYDVFKTSHKDFMGNKVAINLYKNQKIAIDYIKIKQQNNLNLNLTKTNTILFEDFSNNNNSWSISNDENAHLSIKNGVYNFEYIKDNGGYYSTIGKNIDVTKDFIISTELKKIKGVQNYGYGLTFGYKDPSNLNQIYITSDGSFRITKYENGELITPKDWTASNAIKLGNGNANIITVKKEKNTLSYLINNTTVYTTNDFKFYGDRVGFIVYNKQKIAISYLDLQYLNEDSDNNNNTNSDITFNENFNDNSNNWVQENDASKNFYLSNGNYYLEHKRLELGWSSYISKPFDSNKNFEIETDLKHISGNTNSPYGITWGKKDTNYFQFLITATGYYKINRVVNNKIEDIIKWVKSPNINLGSNQSNVVKITKEGQFYKFYINNVYITKIDFEPFYGSQIGYSVYYKQKIAVNYLKLNTIKTQNLYVTKTEKLPFFDDFQNNKNDWGIENTDAYSVNLTNNKLILERKKKGGIFINKDVDIDTSKDFIIETSISKKNETFDSMYGVTFGRQNSANEFTFLLSANGSYKYRKFENDAYKEIIPLTYSSAIKTGNNIDNVIKIVKSGNLLRFYINDTYVNEAPFQNFFGNKFGYTIYYDSKIEIDYLSLKYQTENNHNNPPLITITSPNVELKRGFKIVEAKKVLVKGTALDSDGIYEITVNGIEANVSEDGTFTANVPLKYGKNDLIVKATDIKQASSTKTFVIKRSSPNIDKDVITDNTNTKDLDIGFGKYYALIIGVSDYKDTTIQGLKGEPTKDAQSLADVLTNKYSFAKEDVTVLKNPTENEINREFIKLSRKVGSNDNLVIFYAGHGNYDKITEKGYWMPSNANMEFEENIILNTSIVTYIKAIPSKHTLLISDACFSGSILTTSRSYKSASKAVQKKYDLPSRKAITSGTLTTVPNESVFMKYLLKRLNQNTEQYLSAGQLFNMIEDPVINNTTGDNQPQYAPISRTGDEGGDFIFIKRN